MAESLWNELFQFCQSNYVLEHHWAANFWVAFWEATFYMSSDA